MASEDYRYIIVGGGLAGAAAVEGIREIDGEGRILLVSSEKHLPYDRPPLSKKLWLGKKKVEDIFIHDQAFYAANWTDLALGATVAGIDPTAKRATDDGGHACSYDKLLLATGGVPRTLQGLSPNGDCPLPGGYSPRRDSPRPALDGIRYYRYLDDYLAVRQAAAEGKSAVIIGGGFIGSEMAAALNLNQLDVTMVFPDAYLVSRVFPESLGRALQEQFIARGVTMLSGDRPVSLERRGDKFVTRTHNGQTVESDIVIAGIGIVPATELAAAAGLALENGIVVNEHLQTSHPDIYAAGDNAFFPYQALGQRVRIEHWDNAINQGKWAGRNMAGAGEPFTYMPYFFSDLFEFGYEAVGEVDARLEVFADWRKENDTGVIYYLKDGKVRGAMMCNVWDKVDAARELIRKGAPMAPDDLRGAIR